MNLLSTLTDASKISIVDALGYFTATDVEAALAELYGMTGGGGLPVANPTFTGTITGPSVRITGTDDVELASTTHPFQIGDSSGINMAIDGNEIMVRSNGVASHMYMQAKGGGFHIGYNMTYATGSNPTVFGYPIVEKGGTALSSGYWVKYYDGTMIINAEVTATLTIQTADTSTGGFTVASASTFTLPVSFVNTSYTAIVGAGIGQIGGRVQTKSVGSFTYYPRTITSSASASRTMPIIAVGRWY